MISAPIEKKKNKSDVYGPCMARSINIYAKWLLFLSTTVYKMSTPHVHAISRMGSFRFFSVMMGGLAGSESSLYLLRISNAPLQL